MDTRSKILDIAMNLNRIGNWAADDYSLKEKRIKSFLVLTAESIKDLKELEFSKSFSKTFRKFKIEYSGLQKEGMNGPKNLLSWAESMMTWGNILTHRAKLIEKKAKWV